jgi:hypothetical protein
MSKETFTVKPEHLKLLKRMYIGWEDCEFGAPAVDCKRPYGNSWVYGDIADILDIKPAGENEEEFTDEQEDVMRGLHKEMQTVLQILVKNPLTGIRLGVYQCHEYDTDWKFKHE